MKRICTLFAAVVFCFVMISTCFAEEVISEEENEDMYYVVRPHIKFVLDDGESAQLSFGEKVTMTSHEGTYAFIKTEDGRTGKVTIGFLVPASYPLIGLNKTGCFLSIFPGLTESDPGFGAGGQRWEEKAVIVLQIGKFYLVVTDEGYSGYLNEDDPNYELYTGQVPEGT